MLRLIINLDRCPERWIAMQSQLNSVGLDALRVSAVDSRVREGGGGQTRSCPIEFIKKILLPPRTLHGRDLLLSQPQKVLANAPCL